MKLLNWLEYHASEEDVQFVRKIEREALQTQARVSETLSDDRRRQLRAQIDAKVSCHDLCPHSSYPYISVGPTTA